MNSRVAALRFFFTTTLDRPDLTRKLIRVAYPRKLSTVLSPDEVARLLAATTCLKHRAALSVAYGAGLRVAEVASLKIGDIDSQRMLIRVERGKGRRNRNAMLSADLLALLRVWWKEGRRQGVMLPDGWLFPGQDRRRPISTRQLSRVVEAAVEAANLSKRVSPHTLRHSFATHLLEDGVDIRVIQVLLGHAKLENTAFYTKVATRTADVRAPLEVADILHEAGTSFRTLHAGHLSLAQLKVMAAIRTCRTAALGGHVEGCEDRSHQRIAYNSCRNRHCLKCQGAAACRWLAEREADLLPIGNFHVVFTLPAEIADIAWLNKALLYDLLFRVVSAMTHDPHKAARPGRGFAPRGLSDACQHPKLWPRNEPASREWRLG